MGETAEERARRLARMIIINSTYGNSGGGSEFWYPLCGDNDCFVSDADRIVAVHRQISEEMTKRCTLGYNPLVKFTKFKFNF